MAANILPPLRINHPAPHRGRVGLAALLFGIAAAPVGWNVQLLLSVALSGRACYPNDKPLGVPLYGDLSPILLAISVFGIILALAGGWVAWRSWRQTRNERAGSVHHLLDGGDGRTRFMAMCGLITSTLFLVALIFGAAAFYMVPLCGH